MLTFLVFTTRHVLYLLDHSFFSDNSLSPCASTFPLLNYFLSCPLLKVLKLMAFLTHTCCFPSLSRLELWGHLGHPPLPQLPCSVHLRQFCVRTSHKSVSCYPLSMVPAVSWPSSVSLPGSFSGFSTPYLMSFPSYLSSFGGATRTVYVRRKDKLVSLS